MKSQIKFSTYMGIYHPVEAEIDFSKQSSTKLTDCNEKNELDQVYDEARQNKSDEKRDVTNCPTLKI